MEIIPDNFKLQALYIQQSIAEDDIQKERISISKLDNLINRKIYNKNEADLDQYYAQLDAKYNNLENRYSNLKRIKQNIIRIRQRYGF